MSRPIVDVGHATEIRVRQRKRRAHWRPGRGLMKFSFVWSVRRRGKTVARGKSFGASSAFLEAFRVADRLEREHLRGTDALARSA